MVSPTIPFEYYFMCMTLHDLWNQNRPQIECPVVTTTTTTTPVPTPSPTPPVTTTTPVIRTDKPPPVIITKPCSACPSYGYQKYCDPAECGLDQLCNISLPKNYIAYHLAGNTIKIDGKLDDPAWNDVPWSSKFVDIRGSQFPPPKFDTQFKIRWDDQRLYIGALLKAKDLWAKFTVDDSHVFLDNSFGVFFSPDGTMKNYKQIDINAFGTAWDLNLGTAYIDGPGADDINWSSGIVKAVSSDGPVNDVTAAATHWSVETSIPFANLAEKSTRSVSRPLDDEILFMQFARVEYPFYIQNSKYVKNTTASVDWWSWQPHGVVNLHIPSRWGLVQFSRTKANKGFGSPRWHIYKALFDMHEAMHMYKAVNGVFPDDVRLLNLPSYLVSGECVLKPMIQVTGNGFIVTIGSKFVNEEGQIRADRSVSFIQR